MSHQRTRRLPRSKQHQQRKGAVLVLVALFIVILLGFAAFAVDLANVQLARVELRAATDAAAKAAAASFRTSQNTTTAKTAAKNIALLNQVNGTGYVLSDSNIELGQVAYQSATGKWTFQPNVSPYYSARVTSPLTGATGIKSYFGKIFGVNSYSASQYAVASHYEQQIVLCLDRSHSMTFDYTGNDWSYPPSSSYTTKPHATLSRWAGLKTAVSSFATIINTSALKPQVAMITWGSTINNDSQTHLSFPATATDVAFTTTYTNLNTAVTTRGNSPMLGGTNMAAGLDAAIALLDTSTNAVAKKSIILMSDGMWNQGNNPVNTSANTAKTKGYTIHTISFVETDNAADMASIASKTGGKSYQASDAASLNSIFTELANTLPVVLTE